MKTKLSNGYGAMLSQFLHGWVPGREWYWAQHKQIKPNGDEVWWREVAVESITHLIRILMSYPPSDNFLTATRYAGADRQHATPVYARIWMDLDLRGRDEISVFDELPRLRRVQNELRDSSGGSPVVIVFTGRGFHLWFYLSEPVSLETARSIRAILEAVFQLQSDPKVPIEPHRQMRLPGFIHGATKTPLHSVWCTERMSSADVRQAAIDGSLRWDPVHPMAPGHFLKFDPGVPVVHEYHTRIASKVSSARRVDMGRAEEVLVTFLAAQAADLKNSGLTIDEIAVKLRRSRTEVGELLRAM